MLSGVSLSLAPRRKSGDRRPQRLRQKHAAVDHRHARAADRPAPSASPAKIRSRSTNPASPPFAAGRSASSFKITICCHNAPCWKTCWCPSSPTAPRAPPIAKTPKSCSTASGLAQPTHSSPGRALRRRAATRRHRPRPDPRPDAACSPTSPPATSTAAPPSRSRGSCWNCRPRPVRC